MTTGVFVFVMWTRLIKVDLSVESRIRCLWGSFAGCAVLMSSTAVYFLAEVGAGFQELAHREIDGHDLCSLRLIPPQR